MPRRNGFTLIELVLVLAIMFVVLAIAVPRFGATKAKVYISAMKIDLRNLVMAEELYFVEHETFTGDLEADLADWFSTSAGVSVLVTSATDTAWEAGAYHRRTRERCAITVTREVTRGPSCAADSVALVAKTISVRDTTNQMLLRTVDVMDNDTPDKREQE